MPPTLALVIAYVVGSVPTAYLAGRLVKGVDLRTIGSGNLGATNVYRSLGPAAAAVVLLLDAAKGALPALLLPPRLLEASVAAPGRGEWWALAFGVAAILAGKVKASGPTVTILSGGNIDPLLLQRVVAHGLSASGRYMSLRIPLPDRPGQLARVSELLAQVGANVIEVLHTRHGQGLQISEVILQLSVETRGAEHRALVIETLEDAGFVATVVSD